MSKYELLSDLKHDDLRYKRGDVVSADELGKETVERLVQDGVLSEVGTIKPAESDKERAGDTLKDARADAKRILAEARDKAKEIVAEAEVNAKAIKADADTKLAEADELLNKAKEDAKAAQEANKPASADDKNDAEPKKPAVNAAGGTK